MKWRVRLGQALALVLIGWPAAAAEIYMSADEYMMGSRQERWGFVQGVYDTYGTMARLGGIADPALSAAVQGISDCAAKVSVNELERIFTTWLDAHPDRWNERMPALFLSAVGEQCAGPGATAPEGVNAAAIK